VGGEGVYVWLRVCEGGVVRVCVCVCVFVSVCACLCLCLCLSFSEHYTRPASVHTHVHTYIYTHIRAHTHDAHTCTHTHTQAQCAEEDESEFQNTDKHKYFNTNNLWIRLDKLKEVLDANGGVVPLPMIKNSKTVDPGDGNSPKVSKEKEKCKKIKMYV